MVRRHKFNKDSSLCCSGICDTNIANDEEEADEVQAPPSSLDEFRKTLAAAKWHSSSSLLLSA